MGSVSEISHRLMYLNTWYLADVMVVFGEIVDPLGDGVQQEEVCHRRQGLGEVCH